MAQWRGGQPPAAAPIKRPPLLKVFGLQSLLLVLASASLLLLDVVIAKSALIGGLISVVPNAYFARLAFRHSGARAAKAVTQSFYRGEAGKFVMTVLMFGGVFATVEPLRADALFFAFIAMVLVNTACAWWIGKRPVSG